ncbi:MAG: TIGR04255 family protein [Armatimonadetes bacterium]|nr:TIGR04255 family protein [Armatimonadota bacterium]
MPFPESERVLYKKNPLAEVICQLRFPSILRIGADVPADFQDRVRNDYPIYSLQGPSVYPEIPPALADVMERINLPRPPGSVTHRFAAVDSKRYISLSQNFVALVEKEYSKWELFRQEMQKAEAAAREVYFPAFYSRVGLRYKDVISRQRLGLDGAKWKDLLKPHILGELGAADVEEQIVESRAETVINVPDVPDAHVRLVHGIVELTPTREECYLIDADFWIERKDGTYEPFDVLDRFNRLAGRLFRWAITDTLHNAMEPTALPTS